MTGTHEVELVTGFPDVAIARRVVVELLERDAGIELVCLVSRSQRRRAEEMLRTFADADAKRVRLLEGETWGLDFGLSGAEWKDLARSVVRIHHASQVTNAGLERNDAMRVNRGSTSEVLELARHAPRQPKVVLWSSTSVSGTRTGFVLEDELDARFEARNPVEESLRRSEMLVRNAADEVPITILRPGLVVGDSRTGEIDAREGFFLLILLMLNAPRDRPMPMPAHPDTPLALVPIDYVARAGVAIANDERSVGRTFHLVDPDPLTAERVFELLARAVGRDLPKPILPPFLARRLMRLPGIQPGGAEPLPSAFLDQITSEVIFDDHGSRELLAGTGIACPPFESYVNALVRFVREEQHGAPRDSAAARL